jgi:carbonic anhydrase/acetyltransferase-like protein (isoleucine patch superfamily)
MKKVGENIFVHPASAQTGDVTIGEHSSVWPCSSMRGDFAPIKIGRFTSIQDNCTVHARAVIGDFVTVAHNAVLHGCTVEDNCIISIGAIVQDGAVIGKGSLVAPGAVVRENTVVPPGSLVVGIPGQVKPGRPGMEQMNINNALSYSALAMAYLEGKETISGEELVEKMALLRKKIAV